MSDRPYSRLYWSVMDDDKFDGIREDMRHFGTWSLLLMVADMAWPAPAFLPPAPKASVAALVTAGLVDLLSGNRYRVHGLDAERGRRSDAAREAGLASARSRGVGTPVQRPFNARSTESQLARPSRELAENEPSQADDRDALDRFYELTGWNPWTLDWRREELVALQNDYGVTATIAALDAAWSKNPDRKALTKAAAALLARDADRAKEAARAERKTRPVRVIDPAVLAHELGEDIA